jgi:hypothetical protein
MIKGRVVALLICVFVFNLTAEQIDQGDGSELWTDNYFIQSTVDASELSENIIKAKIEGEWQEYELTEFPEIFFSWDFEKRMETIKNISKGTMPGLAGPHNGMVATYGYRREDSEFKLNNAVKGCGFVPREEKIEDINQLLQNTISLDFPEKLKILEDLYVQGDTLFDMTKQVSLELYSVPEKNTQSFLNQMTNPVSVIVFLDIPTFKLKTISYLLHPENPQLTEYEKNVVDYVNLIHSYFHGEFSKVFITVLYNVVEVYNSSPGNDNGRGKKISP